MVFTLRLLHIFTVNKQLGPKIVIVSKMVRAAPRKGVAGVGVVGEGKGRSQGGLGSWRKGRLGQGRGLEGGAGPGSTASPSARR